MVLSHLLPARSFAKEKSCGTTKKVKPSLCTLPSPVSEGEILS